MKEPRTMPLALDGAIAELEVSVTHRCTLACDQCGFLLPHQPLPHDGDTSKAIIDGLERLAALGIRVDRLVLVGGEPTLAPQVMALVCQWVRSKPAVCEIEVVSNGLSPDRIDPATLRLIDRFIISNYAPQSSLVDLWRRWAKVVAPATVVAARDQEHWDQWTGDAEVDAEEALELWRRCWYRKHCVTLERGRLFSCSRIPKLRRDTEGLALTSATTIDDVRDWLNADRALPSCANCVPMMGFAPVPVAQQPDLRMDRLVPRAIKILQRRIEDASSR